MKVAFRQLQLGGAMKRFADNMAMEYRIGARVVQRHDFLEGVRAVIVDKDNAPKWDPPTLEGVTDAMLDANHFLELGKDAEAGVKFREAIEFDETRWEAHLGYGITELHLHQPEMALAAFDRAETIADSRKASKTKIAGVHYNRACALAALKRTDDAITALRTAIKLSSASLWIDGIETDPDLEPLRGDASFRKFSAEAQLLARKKK
jgi:tetratricopeptide (TPR) repeat protein